MAYQHLSKSLDALSNELKQFLGSTFFVLELVDHQTPWGLPEVLGVGHDGCYLAVTGTNSKYSTITFQVRINLTQWGKPEVLTVQGKFIDTRYGGDRYESWFRNPHSTPYILDILDRVDLMAAYALRLLEKHTRETLGDPNFELMAAVDQKEVKHLVDYFRIPVQLDYRG